MAIGEQLSFLAELDATLANPPAFPPAGGAKDSDFGRFIVYVDESGDHSLVNVDEKFPVFVLSFCIFNKRYYASTIVPQIEQFKFKHFGHDLIVLHESDIRKSRAPFSFLAGSKARRDAFMQGLNNLVDGVNFILVACAVDKRRIAKSALREDDNPYHIALKYCMEGLYEFLEEKNDLDRTTHVIVECRGKKEDQALELEFRRICDGNNSQDKHFPFEVHFADKRVNSSGLQLADLVSRPIGLRVIRPDQPNRAFEMLRAKFFSRGGRETAGADYDGHGLLIYPPQKAKGPGEITEAIAPTGSSQST